MRNKVGCEGKGENAARPASKIGAVVGLSRGMARPVRKLRTESAEKLLFLINSYWLSRPTFDTSHQTDSLTTDSRLTGVAN